MIYAATRGEVETLGAAFEAPFADERLAPVGGSRLTQKIWQGPIFQFERQTIVATGL